MAIFIIELNDMLDIDYIIVNSLLINVLGNSNGLCNFYIQILIRYVRLFKYN